MANPEEETGCHRLCPDMQSITAFVPAKSGVFGIRPMANWTFCCGAVSENASLHSSYCATMSEGRASEYARK